MIRVLTLFGPKCQKNFDGTIKLCGFTDFGAIFCKMSGILLKQSFVRTKPTENAHVWLLSYPFNHLKQSAYRSKLAPKGLKYERRSL